MAEKDAYVGIAQHNRVVHHEEDHAVLPDITHQRHSRRRQREQNPRDAQQREGHDEEHIPEGSYPLVRFHFVLAVQVDVCRDEPCEQYQAEEEGFLPGHAIKNLVPDFPDIKEESAAEDVVEEEPHGVSLPIEPVAYGREAQDDPMQVAHFLDEVHEDVGREEREEEPQRTVSEGESLAEPVELRYLSDGFGQSFGEEAQPEKGQDEPDDAPREVGHEQPTHAVLEIRERRTGDTLVEKARFEKEETHEEERPEHRFLPPRCLSQLCLTDGMKRHHPDDAQPAEQVERVVSFLHELDDYLFLVRNDRLSDAARRVPTGRDCWVAVPICRFSDAARRVPTGGCY